MRVRYTMKTADSATILAQQWDTLHGVTTFRTFNLEKVNAAPHESTTPTPEQLNRNMGCCSFFKSIIGGLTITYIDKAEAGTGFTLDELIFEKLKKQTQKVHRLRIIWFFWLTLAYYGITVPFTAQMASIPLVGGLLLRLTSQTGTMAIFAFMITLISGLFLIMIRWFNYNPYVSLVTGVLLVTLCFLTFKIGTSVPADYAKYCLGYF